MQEWRSGQTIRLKQEWSGMSVALRINFGLALLLVLQYQNKILKKPARQLWTIYVGHHLIPK